MPTFVALLRGINVGKAKRIPRELQAIVDENPFGASAADHSRLLVAFAQEKKVLAGLLPIGATVVAPEACSVGKNAAYLYCAKGILGSKAGEALLGKAGKHTTSRNWATVLKINALANARAT